MDAEVTEIALELLGFKFYDCNGNPGGCSFLTQPREHFRNAVPLDVAIGLKFGEANSKTKTTKQKANGFKVEAAAKCVKKPANLGKEAAALVKHNVLPQSVPLQSMAAEWKASTLPLTAAAVNVRVNELPKDKALKQKPPIKGKSLKKSLKHPSY